MRRSLAEPKSLRASAPIMRFVLSGAAASFDRVRSGADAAGSQGTDQVAAARARVRCIAAAGRGSGDLRASFMVHAGCKRIFAREFMQTADCGRIGRIQRDIRGGPGLVNWRFLLTFSSKSPPIPPLPTGAVCATLRPLPPPAVALTRSRTISLAPKDHLMTAPQLSPAAEPRLAACRPRWTSFAMISVALLVLPLAAGCSK